MATWEIICDDILHWAAEYDGPKFHALIADPPYHLIQSSRGGSMRQPGTGPYGRLKVSTKGFMGKTWDGGNLSFQKETWAALAEHLLPGGFLFVFASSRGWHRLACALEDSGLIIQPSIFNWHMGEVVEIPFCLGWLNAQSFPKSTRIDTQVDKAAGKLEERKIIGPNPNARPDSGRTGGIMGEAKGRVFNTKLTIPATSLARAWEGHRYGGQILKNALEPIIVAQKPWEGKRLDCIVGTGAGSLWVDGARIGTETLSNQQKDFSPVHGNRFGNGSYLPNKDEVKEVQGRWPANFVLCHVPPDENGEGGCERVGVKRVKSSHERIQQVTQDEGKGRSLNTMMRPAGYSTPGYADPDGLETIDEFRCVEECPARKLGKQAGKTGAHGGKGSFQLLYC